MRSPMLVPAAIALLAMTACQRPGVVPMDRDTFLVAESRVQFGSGLPVSAKAEVYDVANEFCAKRGKVLETVNLEITDAEWGRPASVTLVFRCVDPAKPTAGPAQRPAVEKQLEDLKAMQAKGLITQDDFDRKKKELLDRM
jgi:hypothetical protein